LGVEPQNESLEESIFKTLSNQKRRDIMRFIGENKQASFSEIKRAAEIEDSSSVAYHLTNLQTLLTQQNQKYGLSELGEEAYNLIVKTNAYTSKSIVVHYLRRQVALFIVVNALLWAVALLAATEFEGSLTQKTTSTFILLWFIGNALMYLTLRRTSQSQKCVLERT
jgi:hypothetical protein